MQEMKERMRALDFKEAFIERMLKDFSMKKVEEKLDLLRERRNIQKPAGWLSAALKNDYQDVEGERPDEESVGQTPCLSQENQKILSTEEVKRRFKLLRHQLITNTYFRKEEI